MRLIPLACCLAVGCGPGADSGSPGACGQDDPPSLAIGVSQDGFVPVEQAGGEAVLVYGAQGGYHLEIALRATGLDTSDLTSVVMRGTLGGQERAVANTWEQFRCNPDTQTADAWNVRLIYDATPEELGGQSTEIEATVTDATGTTFKDRTTLTILDKGP